MLVNASAYQDGKRIADFGIEDIHKYLQLPGCFVWVALTGCDRSGARRDAEAVRAARARGGGCEPRTSASEARRDEHSLYAVVRTVEIWPKGICTLAK